ncbi:hypothetical protein V6N11_048485 [Hibiscus sabdariffa]|uniref:Uncharacterized protein n=1 Tax=Hibiscus sabdariffa TaxID=183260 RepID=A0ABR2PVL7_9ROSI
MSRRSRVRAPPGPLFTTLKTSFWFGFSSIPVLLVCLFFLTTLAFCTNCQPDLLAFSSAAASLQKSCCIDVSLKEMNVYSFGISLVVPVISILHNRKTFKPKPNVFDAPLEMFICSSIVLPFTLF